MTKKENIERQRERHHAALHSLYRGSLPVTGLNLWRKLRRLESRMEALATDWSNHSATDLERESARAFAGEQLRGILGHVPAGFFINWDARGYQLKLDNEIVTIPDGMWRDLGGYGILAPLIG